jgi:hypothetical protein
MGGHQPLNWDPSAAKQHEAFATWLFSREWCCFKVVYCQALAAEQGREGRFRDATPSNEKIGHRSGFCATLTERFALGKSCQSWRHEMADGLFEIDPSTALL